MYSQKTFNLAGYLFPPLLYDEPIFPSVWVTEVHYSFFLSCSLTLGSYVNNFTIGCNVTDTNDCGCNMGARQVSILCHSIVYVRTNMSRNDILNHGFTKVWMTQLDAAYAYESVPRGGLQYTTCGSEQADINKPYSFGMSLDLTGNHSPRLWFGSIDIKYSSLCCANLGDSSDVSNAVRQGVLVAFHTINEAGGYKNKQVLLITYDDQGDVSRKTSIYFAIRERKTENRVCVCVL